MQKWVLLGVVSILVCFLIVGCASTMTSLDPATEAPAHVEHLEGRIPTRITLTGEASKRIDLQTAEAQAVQVNGLQLVLVAYSAIIYDINGDTWLYASPERLTFERTPIVVDHITGDKAFLSDGPSAGTMVVTRGVAELYGAETEFEEE